MTRRIPLPARVMAVTALVALALMLAVLAARADCPVGSPDCGPDTVTPAAVWLPVVARQEVPAL